MSMSPLRIAVVSRSRLPVVSGPPSATVNSLWTGVPTSDSFMASAKLKDGASYGTARMAVSTSATLSSPVYSGPVTPDATFKIAKMQISGLTPGTQYHYGIEVDGILDTSTVGKFKTPAAGAHSFSLAFGSCNQNYDISAFTAIKAKNPAFFMHLGDFHYENGYTAKGAALAEADYQGWYEAQLLNRGNFHYVVPNSYNWSEHDYLGSAVGRDSAGNPHSKRQVPIDAFRRRVPVPLASATTADPVYYSFVYGRCRFVVIDSMSEYQYAGPLDTSAGNTMLGATQKQWVKDQVAAAAAAGQIVFFVAENSWKSDTGTTYSNWQGFQVERTELTDYFASVGMADKIVILAGDTHSLIVGSSNYGTDAKGFAQPNFQAAPLCQGRSVKGGPWDTEPYPTITSGDYKQFGWVDVVDDGADITVTFTGYDSTSAIVVPACPIKMTGRKKAPSYYAIAAHSGLGVGSVSISPVRPTNTGLNGCLVCVVGTNNNDTHSTATAGWTKVNQQHSGTGFTVSTWVAPEGTAAPTFTWPNGSLAYARIAVFASPSGPVGMVPGAQSSVGGADVPMGGPSLQSTAQDILHLAIGVSDAVDALVSTDWSKFVDTGSGTADMGACWAGRRMTAAGVKPKDIAWTSGASGQWVMSQLHLAVI